MDILIYFAVIYVTVKLKTGEVRNVVSVIDDIVTDYNDDKPKEKRDWKKYERQLSMRIRASIRNLEPLIEEATSKLKIVRSETRGRKPSLTPKQKVQLLLLKHLFGKSNREMSDLLVAFSLLTDIDVSYKTIERLYSDEQVLLIILNIHTLVLRKKNVIHPNCSGDGTGYTLSIKKHYASEAKKLKDKTNHKRRKSKAKKANKRVGRYNFSFRLMDIDTRMYIGYGTSCKSEKEAFLKAVNMTRHIEIESIRLDKYYACQKYVKYLEKIFGKSINFYIIPKKNVTIRGSQTWKKMLHEFVNYTHEYLGEYYKRNQSESGFSEDKRRFGWKISQKREDRIDTSNFCTTLWHNMMWADIN